MVMRRIFSFNIFFIFIFQSSFAQFYVTQDKDGYVLVRSTNNIKAKVTDTLKNGELVFSLEPIGNWIQVEYGENNNHLKSGYIYFDRLKNILDYTKIPVVKSSKGLIVLEKQEDSLSISIKEQRFIKNGHRFTYSKVNRGMLEKIDGKNYWGSDGGIPNMAYKSISITIGSQQYELPNSVFSDLFQPNLENTEAYHDTINNRLSIQSSNSYGAGSYLVLWLIEKGEYKKRLVAHGF
jgi:hypothetical protein